MGTSIGVERRSAVALLRGRPDHPGWLPAALEDAGDALSDAGLDAREVGSREVHASDEDHQERQQGDPAVTDLAATFDEASEGLPGWDFGLRLLPHGGR